MEPIVAARGRENFQEAAAQLFGWGARALYLGPSLNLSAHRNAVAVLALGIEGPFGVADDPADPGSGYRACRSVLIPPDTLHHLKVGEGLMAFLYLDPKSRDLARLRAGAALDRPRASFDLAAEGPLIAALGGLAAGRTDWAATRRALAALLGDPGEIDARVGAALSAIHADPAARLTLDDLARQTGLSGSRLRRLFRAATGVTVRRYRLWAAMHSATRAIARGESLTTAALDAGFSSSAHFSAAFREMFGLEPSRFARGRLAIR